jgi:hypothetical protein
MKNVARAIRWARTGEETTRSGARVRKFDPGDPYSLAEMLAAAAGFTPAALAEKWDQIRAKRAVEMYWTAQRGILFDQFWKASRVRDREALADVKERIGKYNARVPDPGLRISARDLKASVEARWRNVRKQEAGLPVARRMTRTTKAVEGAYPTD